MMRNRTIRMLILGALLLGPAGRVEAMRLEPSREVLSADTYVQALAEPAGLATDPVSGHLYVAEQGNDRISMIIDRRAIPVFSSGFEVDEEIPLWAIGEHRPMDAWLHNRIHRPNGIAFDRDGGLYVAESAAGGRLLRFEPIHDGLLLAGVVPTPWEDHAYGYAGVSVDSKGRIYVSSRKADGPSILSFGRIMMRDETNQWWLVDYGPFAEFSNVAVSHDDRTLVYGEYRTADLCWYDTERQMLFGAMDRARGLRHVELLRDGTTLAAIQRRDQTWSVVEIDPTENRMWEWVGGLSRIGGIHAHPHKREIFISLADEGRVLRLRRIGETREDGVNKLTKMLETFELQHALPPRVWPRFFREFMEELDVVRPVDPPGVETDRPKRAGGAGTAMTIGEFTSSIPLVAARVKAKLISPPEWEPDPIEEVSFVIFYPNIDVVADRRVAPSVSLFRARHRSGRVSRTRFLPNQANQPPDDLAEWDNMPEILVSFPSGYHARRTGQSEDGLLRVYFLGMGLGADYWIDIYRRNRGRSILTVERPDGRKLEYELEAYEERVQAGGETVLVAGLEPVQYGWHKLGKTPIRWNLILDDGDPLATRHMVHIDDVRRMSAGRDAPVTAATYREESLTREEIGFRRTVIMRAAENWSRIYF